MNILGNFTLKASPVGDLAVLDQACMECTLTCDI